MFNIYETENGYAILEGSFSGKSFQVRDEEGNEGLADVFEHLGMSIVLPTPEYKEKSKGLISLLLLQ